MSQFSGACKFVLHEGWGEYSRPKGHYVQGILRTLLFAACSEAE